MQKIDQHTFIPLLLEPLPELADTWIDFQKEWKDDDEGLPCYLFLAQLAEHIAQERENSKSKAFFERVESVLTGGDHYSQEACTVGLLEDLQKNLIKRKEQLSQFEQYMKPQTKKMWKRVIDFWDEGELIKND